MLRFISYLLGKPYEPCKSCETLKEQIHLLQEQNSELLHTLIDRTKPEIRPIGETPKAVTRGFKPWSVKQAELEKKDREQLNQRIRDANPEVVEQIDKLEEELGVKENAS